MAPLHTLSRQAAAGPTSRVHAHAHGPSLLDLNDDLLLAILARLDLHPHGFLLGRTCKRLHALVSSDALRLVVSPSAAGAGAPGTARAPRPPCRAAFVTVAAAVAASRPGDTVVVEAGLTHACADVALTWPLRLIGGVLGPTPPAGGTPPPPALPTLAAAGAGSAATILAVEASCLLHSLRIIAPQAGGPCVWHRAGALRIAQCSLQGVVRPGVEVGDLPPCVPSAPPLRCAPVVVASLHSPVLSTAREAGRDCVFIEETRIAGAEHAPAARWLGDRGGDAVSGIRVVPLPGRAGDLFWMRVAPVRPLPFPPPPGAHSARRAGVREEVASRRDGAARPGLCLHPPPPRAAGSRDGPLPWCAVAVGHASAAAPSPG